MEYYRREFETRYIACSVVSTYGGLVFLEYDGSKDESYYTSPGIESDLFDSRLISNKVYENCQIKEWEF